MNDSSLLNLKILNLILSKILKLNIEAFQNYFYKVKVQIKVKIVAFNHCLPQHVLLILINQVFE
jgi:hypothetical protein